MSARPMQELGFLCDQAPIALMHIDADFRVQAINSAAEAMLGLSYRSLAGRPFGESLVDCDALETLLRYALQSGGDVSAPDIEIRPSLQAPAMRVTVRIRFAGEAGMVLALSQPMVNETDDGVPGVAGMGRILGHEVKNPLAGISGAAQLMLKRGRMEDAELLELIRDEAGRIERLINRFSAFELYSQPSLRPVNIHEVLDRVVSAEDAAFSGRIAYERHYDPSLPDVPIDSDHIHEALLNVLRNGAEAALVSAGDGGGAAIAVSTAFEFNVPIAQRSRLSSRRAIRIDVVDNGPGIDPEKIDMLFEAFEGSKAPGRGLGLAVVREVIAAHNGHVAIDEPDRPAGEPGRGGRGSRVTIYLPIKRKSQS